MKRGFAGFAMLVSCALLARADLDLNGSWEFRFEEGRSYRESANPAFEATDAIPVPGCFDMLPKWLCKRGSGLYRRTFHLDAAVENAWLVVDGMGLTGRFEIDGRDLGVHPYPYAKLEIPTGPLAAGEHTVFAVIDNRFDWDYQKLARPYYDFYCYGGFYHGVSLVFDNRKLFVRTRDFATGSVEVEAVNFKARDFEATLVFDGKNAVKATFRNGRASVRVPDFRLWSPDSPNLHTVTLVDKKQSSIDNCRLSAGCCSLSARFGIRTIEAKNKRLYLNGKPIYLKGANRHEAHPTLGAATSESLMALDIQNLKALGGNFFRGCHYQQAQRFLDLCDEQGVLVWEESLGWGNGLRTRGDASGTKVNEFEDAGFVEAQVRETREMVRASFNHPSVVFFAFMNEFHSHRPECRPLVERLVKAIRDEDSGRLVTWANNRRNADDVCSDLVDVISINTYPGWIDTTFTGSRAELAENVRRGPTGIDTIVARHRAKGRTQPIIVSEMGTCGIYGQHDPAGAQWTEEFQAEYVGDVLDAVFANPEICGIAIWHFADARSYHRAGENIRVKPLAQNLAGLYDGYRRPKAVVKVVEEKFRNQRQADGAAK